METVQQNGRFTLVSSKFHSNIYSILFALNPECFVYLKYESKVKPERKGLKVLNLIKRINP